MELTTPPHSDRGMDSSEEDLFVSPVSDRTSGTRWTRFFPELSSHFTLVSPISSHNNPTPFPSQFRVQSIITHLRQNSSDSEDTAESKTGPPSLWSDEPVDDASSCYSRRSSVTSLGSEVSASAYKSADAFSIISPTRAGVFDDSISVYRSRSRKPRRPSMAESKDKPLPSEPPIQMAPLLIRRRNQPPPTIQENTSDRVLEQTARNSDDEPTLSQAAKELENALAGLVERTESLPRIDTPLQVSRGRMDMIPTRSPPLPPSSSPHSSERKSSPNEDMKNAKKTHKGRSPFSFTVPSFGKKGNHFQTRSLSGPSAITGVERTHAQQGAAAAGEGERESRAVGKRLSGFLSVPIHTQRPASVGSERELRLKLPRLQTKEVQSSGMQCKPEPLQIPAADDVLPEVPQPVSNPRKTFSFESEGSMSRPNKPSKPAGPYCEMSLDSGPIVIYELDAGGPAQEPQTPAPAPEFVPSGEMPGTLPDGVVFCILQQCGSLQDLFNFAVMNRQFYRVFKKHELELIKGTVFAMSPPAWELREMSPPWDSEWQVLFDLDAPVPEYTPSLYLDRYARDLYTLVRLKSLILARCSTFLRPETTRGLAGIDDARATEIDDAFWRVWTFCRIFGCGKGREGDVVGQVDWLQGGVMARSQHTSVGMSITEPFGMNNVLFEPPEGFARGNAGGLSQSQLYDMTEIWTCLGVLLQPIHGKCSEARKAGIFDGHDVPEKDRVKEEATLEEWTSYILTIGPSAVLALGSIATVNNAAEMFQRAQAMGLTKWEPADASRSFFFRDAVSKAYKPREQPARKSPPTRQTGSNSSRSSTSSNNNSNNSNNTSPTDGIATEPVRRRQAAYAAQLRNRRVQNQSEITYAEERPISIYTEIMNRLAGAPAHPLYRPPLPSSIQPTSIPPLHSQPNPPPINTNIQTHNIQVPYSSQPARPPPTPQVRDPADQAIDMMVHDLGFSEEDAKWALKITDTGEGINPNAAVSLLISEYQRQNPQLRENGYSVPVQPQRGTILASVIHSQEAAGSGWRWA
ncbi:hypothetical protein BJX61DRAFT_539438 [Aspergillus egyptiacus]|nr:hypothetical protein BJX61DRAFT_539438 [Aspergillus egyptiacus]